MAATDGEWRSLGKNICSFSVQWTGMISGTTLALPRTVLVASEPLLQ